MELRPYQTDLINKCRAEFSRGKRRVLIVAPCGAGKTVLAAYMAGNCSGPVLFLAHRRELLDQTNATFVRAGIQTDHIDVMSIQTAARRVERLPQYRLVIVDECAHAASDSWSRVLDSQPQAYIVGLTATPCRLDGRGLNGQFDAMVQGITTAELISGGYLAPYRVFVADTIDRAALKTRCGDFTAASVMAQVEQRKIYGHAVTAYKRFCDGLQAIVYCCSIQHSKAVTEAFRTAGIAAEHLDADTPAKQRADIVERFRTGEVKVLSNVDLLGEGFDVPACDAVILQRPTQSLSLHIQQAMRSMRYAPGKTAFIIDHVGNIGKHGLPDEIREWTLDGKPKRTREPGISIGRQCPECGYLNAAGATRCDFCGAEIKPQERQETEIVNAELREITAEERAERLKKRKREEGAARTYEDLIALGRQRGYKPGWAYMRAKARGII
ncbi:MAG: DEAD/DEAH box helicase [Bacteroidales bacterium]|nr:DEAD/DEAH box helicase [Bacteroidales bacterium]